MATATFEPNHVSYRVKGSDEWIDIGQYILKPTFDALADAFEEFGNVSTVMSQKFTLLMDVWPTHYWFDLWYRDHERLRTMHTEYRHKTRRRNRRR